METNTSKHEMVGHQFIVDGHASILVGWYTPDLLRAGDLVHFDENSLSVVAGTRKHRGGTVIISLIDGSEICVCGATSIAVFSSQASDSARLDGPVARAIARSFEF